MYNILGKLKTSEKPLRTFTEQELNLIVDTLSLEFIPKKLVSIEIKNRKDIGINDNWDREKAWIIEYRFTKRKDIHIKEIKKRIKYFEDICYDNIIQFDSTIPFHLVRKAINRKQKHGNKFSTKGINKQ